MAKLFFQNTLSWCGACGGGKGYLIQRNARLQIYNKCMFIEICFQVYITITWCPTQMCGLLKSKITNKRCDAWYNVLINSENSNKQWKHGYVLHWYWYLEVECSSQIINIWPGMSSPWWTKYTHSSGITRAP